MTTVGVVVLAIVIVVVGFCSDNDGAAYHRSLRKHAAFFRACQELDVFDCMDGLRSKGLATDQDVDRSSTETDPKAALKFLYTKLTKLSDDGLYYFVDEILPTLDNTEELLSTLQLCTGPTDCPLKSSQSHCTQEGSMDAAGGVGGLKPEVAVRTLLLLYLFVGTYVCVAVRLFASVAWYVLSRVFVPVTLHADADHCITGSFPAGTCSENGAVHNTILLLGLGF